MSVKSFLVRNLAIDLLFVSIVAGCLNGLLWLLRLVPIRWALLLAVLFFGFETMINVIRTLINGLRERSEGRSMMPPASFWLVQGKVFLREAATLTGFVTVCAIAHLAAPVSLVEGLAVSMAIYTAAWGISWWKYHRTVAAEREHHKHHPVWASAPDEARAHLDLVRAFTGTSTIRVNKSLIFISPVVGLLISIVYAQLR